MDEKQLRDALDRVDSAMHTLEVTYAAACNDPDAHTKGHRYMSHMADANRVLTAHALTAMQPRGDPFKFKRE